MLSGAWSSLLLLEIHSPCSVHLHALAFSSPWKEELCSETRALSPPIHLISLLKGGARSDEQEWQRPANSRTGKLRAGARAQQLTMAVLQRTQVLFPALTKWLTIVLNSTPGDLSYHLLIILGVRHIHGTHMYM